MKLRMKMTNTATKMSEINENIDGQSKYGQSRETQDTQDKDKQKQNQLDTTIRKLI